MRHQFTGPKHPFRATRALLVLAGGVLFAACTRETPSAPHARASVPRWLEVEGSLDCKFTDPESARILAAINALKTDLRHSGYCQALGFYMEMLYHADGHGFRPGDPVLGAGYDMYVRMDSSATTPSGFASIDNNVYVMPSFFANPPWGDKGLMAHESQHVRGLDGPEHLTNESNLAQELCS